MKTTINLLLVNKENLLIAKGIEGMIESLHDITSRPDIIYGICYCAIFQETSKKSHHEGLWYPKDEGINITCYADMNLDRFLIDGKSTSGVCAFMGLALTSRFSKKQASVAISTTEA